MIFSPVTHSHPIKLDKGYEFWLPFDKLFIDRCQGMIMAPEWEESSGCVWEKEYAESLGLTIFYFNDIFPLLKEE
jgi:hypothetical protein